MSDSCSVNPDINRIESDFEKGATDKAAHSRFLQELFGTVGPKSLQDKITFINQLNQCNADRRKADSHVPILHVTPPT